MPPAFHTFDEALQALERLDWQVQNFGLERIKTVLQALGNPQDSVPSIHLVGTNGKGSTSAVLESIYRHAGYKTGLFTSPHLVDLRERVQINGHLIDKTRFLEAANQVQSACTQTQTTLTYFEFINALAFVAFADEAVDIAIIEAGMGGRLDSTNTMAKPLATVVTRIDYDHVDRLGPTLTHIAAEKCGVFRPHVPVVSIKQPAEAAKVIEQRAIENQASLITSQHADLVLGQVDFSPPFRRQLLLKDGTLSARTSLLGRYQQENIQLALSVIDTLQHSLPVSSSAIGRGLSKCQWPGRLEHYPQFNCLIDGSHNAGGIQSLIETWQQDFAGHFKLTLGLTLLQNRDPEILVPLLRLDGLTSIVLLTPPEPERFHPPCLLAKHLQNALTGGTQPVITDEMCSEKFLHLDSGRDSLKIITGSLYTAGHALGFASRALESFT